MDSTSPIAARTARRTSSDADDGFTRFFADAAPKLVDRGLDGGGSSPDLDLARRSGQPP